MKDKFDVDITNKDHKIIIYDIMQAVFRRYRNQLAAWYKKHGGKKEDICDNVFTSEWYKLKTLHLKLVLLMRHRLSRMFLAIGRAMSKVRN
ncbi:hypothetical protein H6P81_015893 [Aristolochia fimbriata]|uniref:Uncharacterized protein n=1 Tax=Aristolochia fimbriata TaxID=158543 RepID=A0AAV7E797_ARIFI|nr:hypothetical protein H6P81_015893 [Aristolochia fimbriata]